MSKGKDKKPWSDLAQQFRRQELTEKEKAEIENARPETIGFANLVHEDNLGRFASHLGIVGENEEPEVLIKVTGKTEDGDHYFTKSVESGTSTDDKLLEGLDINAIPESMEDDSDYEEERLEGFDSEESGETVVRLVNLILVDAVRRGAQEIHVEPYEEMFDIRYRLDGVLYEIMKPPVRLASNICNRIMIMAELDIGRKKTAQLGKLSLVLGKKNTRMFKVVTLPVPYGVKIVLVDETVDKVVVLGKDIWRFY